LEQSRRAPRGEAVLDKRGDEAARVPAYRPAVRQPGFTNGERETPETETAGAAAVRTIAPAALAPDWARCIPESGARLPKPGFARRRNAVRVHVGLLETGSERKAQPADGQRLAGRWKRQVA
jgi:hypothetical protein